MTASEFTLSECTRNNLCVDCDDERCWFRGKWEADCPKYHCDNATCDCSRCPFLKRYVKEMRAYYAKQSARGDK